MLAVFYDLLARFETISQIGNDFIGHETHVHAFHEQSWASFCHISEQRKSEEYRYLANGT